MTNRTKERSSRIIEDTLGENYNGILISDFYSAYNKIKTKGKQKCLSHLLSDIKRIEEKLKGIEDKKQIEKLKSTIKQAIKLKKEKINGKVNKIIENLISFITYQSNNNKIKNLQKRITKHHNQLLTFLHYPDIEPTNNLAERLLRKNVIMRKITFGNRSEKGVETQCILASVIQTSILNNIKISDIFTSLNKNPEFILEKIQPL